MNAGRHAARVEDLFEPILGRVPGFRNNISLFDDPMDVIEALASYVKAAHIKDIRLRPYEDGFEMPEVPLGTAFPDLPRIVSLL